MVVPAEVPSDFQSSVPLVGLFAVKKRVPLTTIKLLGEEEPFPDFISLIIVVPVGVPSDFQSSFPLLWSLAVKKRVPLKLFKLLGEE